MSPVPCRKCGKEVARMINQCPHCGMTDPGLPLSKEMLLWFGCLTLAAGFIVAALFFVDPPRPVAVKQMSSPSVAAPARVTLPLPGHDKDVKPAAAPKPKPVASKPKPKDRTHNVAAHVTLCENVADTFGADISFFFGRRFPPRVNDSGGKISVLGLYSGEFRGVEGNFRCLTDEDSDGMISIRCARFENPALGNFPFGRCDL